MEKQPKQHERHTERFLQIFDLFKPRIIWLLLVAAAIYSYFHPSNLSSILELLILMAAAQGSLSLPYAINLLQGRSIPMRSSPLSLSKEQEADSQLEEQEADKQDELE